MFHKDSKIQGKAASVQALRQHTINLFQISKRNSHARGAAAGQATLSSVFRRSVPAYHNHGLCAGGKNRAGIREYSEIVIPKAALKTGRPSERMKERLSQEMKEHFHDNRKNVEWTGILSIVKF